jgi:transcriptional regulator with XRE-family HTH domain
MNEVPNNLRNIRKAQTDKQLRSGSHIAELMDITVQYYYDLETGRGGRKLNIQHITKLAQIFNCTANEILAETYTVKDESNKEELKKFIADKGNEPYIILSAKAHKSGISPETLEKLIDLYTKK